MGNAAVTPAVATWKAPESSPGEADPHLAGLSRAEDPFCVLFCLISHHLPAHGTRILFIPLKTNHQLQTKARGERHVRNSPIFRHHLHADGFAMHRITVLALLGSQNHRTVLLPS